MPNIDANMILDLSAAKLLLAREYHETLMKFNCGMACEADVKRLEFEYIALVNLGRAMHFGLDKGVKYVAYTYEEAPDVQAGPRVSVSVTILVDGSPVLSESFHLVRTQRAFAIAVQDHPIWEQSLPLGLRPIDIRTQKYGGVADMNNGRVTFYFADRTAMIFMFVHPDEMDRVDIRIDFNDNETQMASDYFKPSPYFPSMYGEIKGFFSGSIPYSPDLDALYRGIMARYSVPDYEAIRLTSTIDVADYADMNDEDFNLGANKALKTLVANDNPPDHYSVFFDPTDATPAY